MNIIRTIQATEDPVWVDLLFKKGPHLGTWVPLYPYTLPFPCRLREGLVGGQLYVLYRRNIIGYGLIEDVVRRRVSMVVGTHAQLVRPGDTVIIAGVYNHMPYQLRQVNARGFMGPRYTDQQLHNLDPVALRCALKDAGVTIY